jgi:hypothetical protein
MRVYSRNRDERVCDAIKQAFEGWKNKELGREVNFATPLKRQPQANGGIEPGSRIVVSSYWVKPHIVGLD